MAKINLGKVVDREDWALIEEITLDGTTAVVKRTGLQLNKMEVFIAAQAAAANVSYAIEIWNKDEMFGYAWVGNGIGTSVIYSRVSAESGNKPFATVLRYVPSATVNTLTAVQGLQTFKDGSVPIDVISVYTANGTAFPAGTIITIYGVRA